MAAFVSGLPLTVGEGCTAIPWCRTSPLPWRARGNHRINKNNDNNVNNGSGNDRRSGSQRGIRRAGSCARRRATRREGWRGCGDQRKTEFNLTPADETSRAPSPVDWDAWAASASTQRQVLPALSFPPAQVFLPGESKRLHLVDARCLAALEAAVTRFDSRCAHVLIDAPRRAMAAVAALLAIRKWQRLEVGVCVTVEAVGRLKTTRLHKSAPFLTAEFLPVRDENNNPFPNGPGVVVMRGTETPRLEKDGEHSKHQVQEKEVEGGKEEEEAEDCKQSVEAQAQRAQRLEERFWNALRDATLAADALGLHVLREKEDAAQATLDAVEAGGGTRACDVVGAPAARPQVEGGYAAVEAHIRLAAERAVAYARLDWASDSPDAQTALRRAHALSFAAWDAFPSTAQQRQRAIESRDALARLSTAVDAMEVRAKQLAAQKALDSAFSP